VSEGNKRGVEFRIMPNGDADGIGDGEASCGRRARSTRAQQKTPRWSAS
jgi:hypothetical protein